MNTELILWTKKILIIIAISLFGYLLYALRDILFIVIISVFLTIIVIPLVEKGEKYSIPAWCTLLGVIMVFFLLMSIVVSTLIPIVINYITDVVNAISSWTVKAKDIYTQQGIQGFHFHPYIERGILILLGETNINHILDLVKQNAGNIQLFLTNQIGIITSGGISIVGRVGGAIGLWLIIIVATFLMVLERNSIARYFLSFVGEKYGNYLISHYKAIQHVFSSWLKATLILSVSIFAMTYLGLLFIEWIFGIYTEKALTLAIIGGIMEFIPYVGPLIALIPAVIIALGISWKAALIITILYLIIQRVENDFLVPYVMSRALNLSPFFVFIVMLAGVSLGGVLGIILAIPIAGILRMVLEEYRVKYISKSDSRSSAGRKKLINKNKSI